MHGIELELDPEVAAIGSVHLVGADDGYLVRAGPADELIDDRHQRWSARRLLHGARVDKISLHVDDEECAVLRPDALAR